jgi:4-diphosphocytidyl-2-C-methyl-D-erythritol kinase
MKMAIADSGVRVFAPAKINLFLHVGEKRADGYHALQSLVCFAEIGDDLTIFADDDLSLLQKGEFAGALPAGDGNLVLKAARTFAAVTGRNASGRFELTKNLPVASGIGGGSADAAAVLRGLRSIWQLSREGDEILWGHWEPFANRVESLKAAIAIGSDVPVCLLSAPAFMEGRGERIWSLRTLPNAALVLVNPGVGVSTAEVFGLLEQRTGANEMIPSVGNSIGELVTYLKTARNDLEKPARLLTPLIGDVLEALEDSGALLARMSGSGATCFGVFETDADAQVSAAAIAGGHPDWWVRATRIAAQSAGLPRPLTQ